MRLHFFNSAVIANSKMDYYVKIELSSLREMLLFLTTNMAAVTSSANQQLSNSC